MYIIKNFKNQFWSDGDEKRAAGWSANAEIFLSYEEAEISMNQIPGGCSDMIFNIELKKM